MNKKNGTTEAVGRRLEVGQRENEPGGLVALRDNSSINGIDQIGIAPVNSPGENKHRASIREKSDSGKILERLELIEKTFLSYVHGQQEHFETRLEESKGTENLFKEEVLALKQEICDLVSTEPQIKESI